MLNSLTFVFMLLAFVSVIAGTVVMVIGGNINKKYGNKLMQLRVFLQALAIILLFLAYNNSQA